MSPISANIPVDSMEQQKLRAIRELYSGIGEFHEAITQFSKGAEKLLFGFYHATTQFTQVLMSSYELIQLSDSLNKPSNDAKKREA